MRKKFKFKKKKKRIYKIFVFILILPLVFHFCFIVTNKIKLSSSNEEFLKKLMFNSNHYLNYENDASILDGIINYILDIDFSNPLTLVSKELSYQESNNEEIVFMVNVNDTYLEDPIHDVINKPRVYIYNSHQSEEYSSENYKEYGITPGVMMASYLLKEKLNSLNIPTIAEEGNIVEFMRVNNYSHAYSYIASRYFIEPVIKENDFDLIIDLHRDSNNKESSTVSINNKKYAKVLFVVGLENENYKENLKLTESLNNLILKKYPTLTRGIYKKEGPGVDGVYNQDLNSNIILLEVGGYQNTISEVNNTLELVAEIIAEYLENIWKKKKK